MKKISFKKALIVLTIIIFIIALIVGVRYLKYNKFIGEFVSDSGDAYKFNLFSWSHDEGKNDGKTCDLWNCNNHNGPIYYVKGDRLYIRYDKNSLFDTKYKIEEKDNKTYLYFYSDSNELEKTYTKNK